MPGWGIAPGIQSDVTSSAESATQVSTDLVVRHADAWMRKMKRAFSAGRLGNHRNLGRCPRLVLNVTPLAFQHSNSPLLSRETPEQKNTQHDKENVRKPDEQFRVRMRIPAQRVANDHEQEVSRGNNQPHGEAN